MAASIAAVSLALTGVVAFAAPAAAASGDLFISEYVEGSSNNKAIEIYNPGATPVDLAASGYKLQQYSNGSASAGLTVTLTGTVAPGGVFVFAHSGANATILAQADQTVGTGLFNGNDAVALVKGTDFVDVIGQIGNDPGTQWGTGLASTADNTLRRNANIVQGDTNGSDAFDPAVEWTGFASDTVDGLGWHLTPPDPEPELEADCAATPVTIGSVQGPGAASPIQGQDVLIKGVVVGDFQADGGFDGYYVQDAGDGDPATSDGVFVYAEGGADVAVGDSVSVAGEVAEYFGLTQVVAGDVEVCATGQELPAPAELTLPATTAQREALEGMSVTLPQNLAIGETFEYGRFGTITLTNGRLDQPTAVVEPGAAANALAAANLDNSITLDDGRGTQNPDPAIHPDGEVFTLEHSFRSGDLVQNATGVLDYRFDTWGVQPTTGADFTVANARPAVPDVGGDLKISSFNVLNYFTTIDPTPTNDRDDDRTRGADSAEELQRQQDKIVAALAAIDADVFGLLEIENNGTAVQTLADALNAKVGAGTYVPVNTGVIGTDAIATAIIYKPSTVTPVGAHQLMSSAVDPTWSDERHRPAVTQRFAATESGDEFVVSVNHLKSKGSACTESPDLKDGQGNCSASRTAAATALTNWLNTTVAPDGRAIVIGDLNSYDHEDSIDAFVAGGFTDLEKRDNGEHAYSYVFDGQLGYLDYALAQPALTADVSRVSSWHINSDEPSLIDYDMSFKQPAQDALYAPDPYRSSDHDPVIVGLNLTPDTTAPTLEVTADAETVWPPNNKMRTIEFSIDAADDRGDVTVELTDIEASTAKADWEQIDDDTVDVKAVKGAVYRLTWTATDAAGNTTIETVEVSVRK
ncbi:ExeM/NucH family extracellular endonuclease [Microbacterium sp. M3]|uniref:ExeM/NucH family extracellular endonuclease n=1 Tax=Microbacterium arthrosphaerae TaxID=792652 RepID=A0ABU4H4G1_9MICO|nr:MULTISPECIES: ExeM/NucH family extracellular endonuclease [Microbacterium]MDW4574203.1 ExeM/NucH family extracellular endonuclease [Microbacterium arthrosphaerae]MDW7608058.1 ExeM/NucH family extracellular endonuclease [Microbacterium sp. M3]